jgi:hypothetical protein
LLRSMTSANSTWIAICKHLCVNLHMLFTNIILLHTSSQRGQVGIKP